MLELIKRSLAAGKRDTAIWVHGRNTNTVCSSRPARYEGLNSPLSERPCGSAREQVRIEDAIRSFGVRVPATYRLLGFPTSPASYCIYGHERWIGDTIHVGDYCKSDCNKRRKGGNLAGTSIQLSTLLKPPSARSAVSRRYLGLSVPLLANTAASPDTAATIGQLLQVRGLSHRDLRYHPKAPYWSKSGYMDLRRRPPMTVPAPSCALNRTSAISCGA
jgi:hypothetical protein